MTKILVAAAASTLASVLTLTACGSSTPPAAPSTSAAAPSTASTSAAAPSPSASQTSAGTASAGVTDPCTVLTPAEVAKATGAPIVKGTASDAGGTKLCIWTAKDTTSRTANFTAQEGPTQGVSLSKAEDALKKQYGGTVTTVSIAGADEARYITGKIEQVPVVDIIAIRGDVYYQVLAAAPGGAEKYKAGVTTMVEALLAG